MSEPLLVAFVGEGPTDRIVVEAAIANLVGDRHFILKQLQPEESLAFGVLGTGWGGVYRWCHQAARRAGGAMRNDPLFVTYDLLVLHLDAEVATENYANAGINDPANDLPCDQPCPPASATTNALRVVLLHWVGETAVPPKTVLCTPSKSTETWVLCSLYPLDGAVLSGGVECEPSPDTRLQAKPARGRVITGGKKIVAKYRDRAHEITVAWAQVRNRCTEAERFSTELLALV